MAGRPLLADPETPWPHPAITTYDFDEFSVRDERWRYIRYIDGSEELYDHEADPEEWTDVAADPRHASVIQELASHIPENPAPMVKTSYEIMPHHFPPYWTPEDYTRRTGRRIKDR